MGPIGAGVGIADGVMRQNSNHKRPRNRGNAGRKPTNNRNQTFDSNGPNVRIRGNAYQVHEKYLTLARDASSSGDRVMAENYFQHAEHYYRVINATTDPASANQANQANGAAAGNHNNNGAAVNGHDRDDALQAEQPQMPDPQQGGQNGGQFRQEEVSGNDPRGEKRTRRSNGRRPPAQADGDQDEGASAASDNASTNANAGDTNDGDGSRDEGSRDDDAQSQPRRRRTRRRPPASASEDERQPSLSVGDTSVGEGSSDGDDDPVLV